MISDFKATFSTSSVSGYLAVILAAACWGTAGIFVRFVLDGSHFSSLSLAFWRDMVTFGVLLTGMGFMRPAWLRVQKRDLPWLIGVGVSVGSFHLFWNLAVSLNGPAVATVQQAAMPVIVAVAARLLWRESLGWRKIAAITLTFTGTALASDIGVLSRSEFNLYGAAVGFGLPFTYAGWTLFGKKVRNHYNPLTVLTYGFGFGALTLLPFQFFTAQPWPVAPVTWLWFAGMIFLPTLGAWYAYMFGLGRLPASVVSIIAMAEIAFVAVYAYLLFNELMTALQTLGAALVVAGVVLLFLGKGARA